MTASLQFLSIDDLAAVFGVSVRTARRWAAEDDWRRTRVRPLRYYLGDAQASYDRRQGSRVDVARLERRLASALRPGG